MITVQIPHCINEKAMPDKTCTKCKQVFPATLEFFYKQSSGKYGVTPRCKSCVNDDNKEQKAKRMAKNPERERALASARTKRSYYNNLEERREYNRNKVREYLKCPEFRKKRNMRKRAGDAKLTPEQFEQMFEAQGKKCAICSATEPGSKVGWNIDHCHKTKAVRFILCAHCNRGLGAFRDNPDIMRKAADMIEIFYSGRYQNQPDEPVKAIFR